MACSSSMSNLGRWVLIVVSVIAARRPVPLDPARRGALSRVVARADRRRRHRQRRSTASPTAPCSTSSISTSALVLVRVQCGRCRHRCGGASVCSMTPSCWSGAGWPETAVRNCHMFAPLDGQAFQAEWKSTRWDAMRGMKVFGCASALALLVAATAASAQEGEGVKSLLGAIGIIPKEKPPINYSERAPSFCRPKWNCARPQRRAALKTRRIGQRIRTSSPPARQRPRPELQRRAPKSIVPTVGRSIGRRDARLPQP